MQQMMGSMGGMGQMMAGPFGRMGGQAAIAEGQQQRGEGQQIAARHQGFADPFGDIFGNMDRMMQGMMGNMSHMMVSQQTRASFLKLRVVLSSRHRPPLTTDAPRCSVNRAS